MNQLKAKSPPESYSPKMPEIANIMKQAGMEIKESPPQYMIDTVFPTGDNPWTGGYAYLRYAMTKTIPINSIGSGCCL